MRKVLFMVACMAIVFGVNAQALKVSSVGNVGIGTGTTTPSQKLHVVGNSYLNGNVGIGDVVHSTYRLQVGGQTRFAPGWIGLILGWSSDNYCPAIYTEYNNAMWIGRSDRWANHLWCYNIDYQNMTKLSDARLKENVQSCSSLLTKLKEVRTYTYNYTDEYFKDFTPAQKQKAQRKEFGFIAQELEKIFPELVYAPDSMREYYGVDYVGMVPILVEAIKEQQNIIENIQQEAENRNDELLQKIKSLESALAACCNNKSQKSTQNFDLSDLEEADTEKLKIYQNVPNPFNETTIISCYIPETIKKAELCIYDMQSSLLKCLTITERGATNIQIQAGQLAAGVYTYLLIGDGKNSDAKQMILTR